MNRLYQLAILFLVFALLLERCSSCRAYNALQEQYEACQKAQPRVEPVMVTAIDTVNTHTSDTVVKTELRPYKVVERRVDSFVSFEVLPFDTAAALKHYFATAYYADTTRTKYGPVLVFDTLSENRIKGRSVVTDFTIPTVIMHETQTVVPPSRNQVYFSLMASGTKALPLERLGAGFLLKTKRDAIWHLYSFLDRDGQTHFEAGRSWKISFHH